MRGKGSASKRPENTSEQGTKYRVEFAPRALREIGEAAQWLGGQASPSVAERWREGLFDRIASLESFPERCPVADETDAEGREVRQLFHGEGRGQYRVLYAIHGEVSRVLAVRHCARDFARL